MLDCAAVSTLRTMFSFNRGADIRAVIIVLRAEFLERKIGQGAAGRRAIKRI